MNTGDNTDDVPTWDDLQEELQSPGTTKWEDLARTHTNIGVVVPRESFLRFFARHGEQLLDLMLHDPQLSRSPWIMDPDASFLTSSAHHMQKFGAAANGTQSTHDVAKKMASFMEFLQSFLFHAVQFGLLRAEFPCIPTHMYESIVDFAKNKTFENARKQNSATTSARMIRLYSDAGASREESPLAWWLPQDEKSPRMRGSASNEDASSSTSIAMQQDNGDALVAFAMTPGAMHFVTLRQNGLATIMEFMGDAILPYKVSGVLTSITDVSSIGVTYATRMYQDADSRRLLFDPPPKTLAATTEDGILSYGADRDIIRPNHPFCDIWDATSRFSRDVPTHAWMRVIESTSVLALAQCGVVIIYACHGGKVERADVIHRAWEPSHMKWIDEVTETNPPVITLHSRCADCPHSVCQTSWQLDVDTMSLSRVDDTWRTEEGSERDSLEAPWYDKTCVSRGRQTPLRIVVDDEPTDSPRVDVCNAYAVLRVPLELANIADDILDVIAKKDSTRILTKTQVLVNGVRDDVDDHAIAYGCFVDENGTFVGIDASGYVVVDGRRRGDRPSFPTPVANPSPMPPTMFAREHDGTIRPRVFVPLSCADRLCHKDGSTRHAVETSTEDDVIRGVELYPVFKRKQPTSDHSHLVVAPSWSEGCHSVFV